MAIAFWIINGLLALAFVGSGVMKLMKSRAQLAESGMAWANDFSAPAVKMIGAAQVLGAIGLIVPALVDIASVLAPIAAVCLAVIMVGAVVVHVRRNESAAPAIVLALLTIVSAVLGFMVLS